MIRPSNRGTVFRGCVALAYPDTWTGGRDPEREDIILQEEAIPLVNEKPADQSGALVHFDLDPQNGEYLVEHGLELPLTKFTVMIGDFDGPNNQTQAHLHNLTPIFKARGIKFSDIRAHF